MKDTGKTFIPMIMVAVMMLAGACQSGQKGAPVLISDMENSDSQGGIESFNQIYHLYPSPAEMLGVIDLDNMTFNDAILNQVENADQYLDSKAKSYALGLYMTDLAYAALFGRHEETLDYLETVKSLAEEINITEAIDESMIDKARDNVEYLDSLYSISNEAFMNILSFCEKNERPNTVVMLSAGAFAESLFLAVNMIEDYGAAGQLLQHLADQKFTIDNFTMFAQSIDSDDPGVQSTILNLEKIKAIYDGIESGTGGVTIKTPGSSGDSEAKKLVIGGADEKSQPSLTENDFLELKAAVVEWRNSIVQANQ